jgi:hypothetical protein
MRQAYADFNYITVINKGVATTTCKDYFPDYNHPTNKKEQD